MLISTNNIFLVCTALLCSGAFAAVAEGESAVATNERPAPTPITGSDAACHVGRVLTGTKIERSFILSNELASPIQVHPESVSCTCLSLKINDTEYRESYGEAVTVEPDGRAMITVTFEAKGQGYTAYEVLLKTTDPDREKVHLALDAEIEDLFDLGTTEVLFSELPLYTTTKRWIRVSFEAKKGISGFQVGTSQPWISASLTRSRDTDEPLTPSFFLEAGEQVRSCYLLISLRPERELGVCRFEEFITLAAEAVPFTKTIRVQGYTTGRVKPSERQLLVIGSKTRDLVLENKSTIPIAKVEVLDEDALKKMMEINVQVEQARATVKLQLTSEHAEAVQSTPLRVNVVFADSHSERVEIPILMVSR